MPRQEAHHDKPLWKQIVGLLAFAISPLRTFLQQRDARRHVFDVTYISSQEPIENQSPPDPSDDVWESERIVREVVEEAVARLKENNQEVYDSYWLRQESIHGKEEANRMREKARTGKNGTYTRET